MLSTRITACDRPRAFTDSMVRGVFARFDHHHRFASEAGGTRIDEVFDYMSPLGSLGRLADALFLRAYMQRFLAARLRTIQSVAESDRWREYLPSHAPAS